MLKPLAAETPIDGRRYRRWLASFSTYVSPVTRPAIDDWLQQFVNTDRDAAARVLDAVMFVGTEKIMSHYKDLLRSLDGWNEDPAKRRGRWFFVPFSSSSGESGDAMVHAFRMANGMTQKKYGHLFIHRSELVSRELTPDDTVILIDDFSATGTQAKNAWNDLFAELLYGEPRIFLMLIVATAGAIDVVREHTEMELVCGTILDQRHNFFSDNCTWFSKEEKTAILRYCKKADRNNPLGWGDSGLLVVMQHRCPNNSLPILHANNDKWTGLFPRQFD